MRLWQKICKRTDRYLYLLPSGDETEDLEDHEPFTLVRVDAGNAHLLREWRGIRPSLRKRFAPMLVAGEIGYFLLDGTTVASHVWLVFNRGERVLDRGYIRVFPGEGYVHFLRTYRTIAGSIWRMLCCSM